MEITQYKEKKEIARVHPASPELHLHAADQGAAQLCHIMVKLVPLFWACLQDNY